MRPHAQASIEDACSIAATELRGITLTQLRDLWTKIAGLADEDGYLQGWKDRNDSTVHTLDTRRQFDLAPVIRLALTLRAPVKPQLLRALRRRRSRPHSRMPPHRPTCVFVITELDDCSTHRTPV